MKDEIIIEDERVKDVFHPSSFIPHPSILIAGIGNVFLGDDGFGVEVTKRLAQRDWPDGVKVIDFGIRGMDLVYALCEDYDAFIFVDITARGEAPGTLYLIEPEVDPNEPVTFDVHGMDPVKIMALARTMGARPTPSYLVACEPERVLAGETCEDVLVELSAPVRASIDEAMRMVENLVDKIRAVSLVGGEKDAEKIS